VVAVGLTLVDPLAAVDENDPGVMFRLDAPLVAQLRVALEPALILAGFAPKEVMTGADWLAEAGGSALPEPPQLVKPGHSSNSVRIK
jgi:hypothetical protein